MKKLNLGCGEDYKEGWINIDVNKNYKADIYSDINIFPYPFKNNEFDEVYASMILEHLDNPILALKELSRIPKQNAIIKIIVPHATSYSNLGDLQHKFSFTESTFEKNLLIEYGINNLVLINKKFLFENNKWKKLIPFKKYLKIFFNGIYDDILFKFKVIK